MRSYHGSKGRSLDGSVSGIHYNHHQHGLGSSLPEPYSREHLAGQGHRQMPTYDPELRQYDHSGPEYQADAFGSELPLKPVLPFRYPPLPTVRQPEDIDYKTWLEQMALIDLVIKEKEEQALSNATDPFGHSPQATSADFADPAGVDPDATPATSAFAHNGDQSLGDIGRDGIPPSDNEMQSQDTPADHQPPPDLAAPAQDPWDLDSMLGDAANELQQDLEYIVQQAMPEPEPDPLQQEKRMYEQEYEEMMNLGGMFGPMGPMM